MFALFLISLLVFQPYHSEFAEISKMTPEEKTEYFEKRKFLIEAYDLLQLGHTLAKGSPERFQEKIKFPPEQKEMIWLSTQHKSQYTQKLGQIADIFYDMNMWIAENGLIIDPIEREKTPSKMTTLNVLIAIEDIERRYGFKTLKKCIMDNGVELNWEELDPLLDFLIEKKRLADAYGILLTETFEKTKTYEKPKQEKILQCYSVSYRKMP